MVSGWYGHIMAVYLGNIVQDPTNQFTHSHTRCAVLARHSAARAAHSCSVWRRAAVSLVRAAVMVGHTQLTPEYRAY